MALTDEAAECEAILQAWYPGQDGGTAIADVLYGDINPSGKLPLTFYKSTEQLPDFGDYNMAGHTYRFFKGDVLYPFGYGLSYTSFKVSKPRIRDGKAIVKVKNTGKRDGEEVIQLYVSRPGDADGPVRTLRAYKRVSVPAGKKVRVEIPLDDETFTWWNPETSHMEPLPGKYLVQVGTSSAAKDLKSRKYKF